jgi:hypothetical protein
MPNPVDFIEVAERDGARMSVGYDPKTKLSYSALEAKAPRSRNGLPFVGAASVGDAVRPLFIP